MRNHTVKRGGVQRATPAPMDNSAEARFGKHVTPQPNGCWAWKGDLTKYGKFDVGRVQTPAHRFAFEVMVGPIPDGHHIHHACKNPGCVNPEHLVSVSPKAHQWVHTHDRTLA